MAHSAQSLHMQLKRATPVARCLLRYGVIAALCGLTVLTLPVAQAGDTAADSGGVTNTANPAPAAPAFPHAGPDMDLIDLGADLGNSELEGNRARALLEIDKVFINDQELNGTVSDNIAINSHNGDNNIGGNAFSSASGFVNTIQNTGNNVLIQSATIVNVSIED